MRTSSETVRDDYVVYGEFGPGRTVEHYTTTTYVHVDTEKEKEEIFKDVQTAKRLIHDHPDFVSSVTTLCDEFFNKNIHPKYVEECVYYDSLPKWKKFYKSRPHRPRIVDIEVPNSVIHKLRRIREISKLSDNIKTFYTPLEKALYEDIVSIRETLSALDSYLKISNIRRSRFSIDTEIALILHIPGDTHEGMFDYQSIKHIYD
jgi:hypothetical protein